MSDVVINTTATVTEAMAAPTHKPLQKRRMCVSCEERSREYSQVCIACGDVCLCTACEAQGAESLPRTACCNNYYCHDCRDGSGTELFVVCPGCSRSGCVECFDGHCGETGARFCEMCLKYCNTCGEDLNLKEFLGGFMTDGDVECNTCQKNHEADDKKRKRREEKEAAAAKILKQQGMENPSNDANDDDDDDDDDSE